MTISTLKKTFKTSGKLSLSQKSSSYNSKIIETFNKSQMFIKQAPLGSKITFPQKIPIVSPHTISGGSFGGQLPTKPSQITEAFPPPLPPVIIPLSGTTTASSQDSSEFTVVIHQNPTQTAPVRQTSITAPSAAANSDSFTGQVLSDAERPSIVSIYSSNIVDGIPLQNIIFIRALHSQNKKALKYSILKKDVLKNEEFIKIFEQTSDKMPSAFQYSDILQKNEFLLNSDYAIVDKDIKKNKIYIYKLKIEWANKTSEEIINTFKAGLTNPAPIPNFITTV